MRSLLLACTAALAPALAWAGPAPDAASAPVEAAAPPIEAPVSAPAPAEAPVSAPAPVEAAVAPSAPPPVEAAAPPAEAAPPPVEAAPPPVEAAGTPSAPPAEVPASAPAPVEAAVTPAGPTEAVGQRAADVPSDLSTLLDTGCGPGTFKPPAVGPPPAVVEFLTGVAKAGPPPEWVRKRVAQAFSLVAAADAWRLSHPPKKVDAARLPALPVRGDGDRAALESEAVRRGRLRAVAALLQLRAPIEGELRELLLADPELGPRVRRMLGQGAAVAEPPAEIPSVPAAPAAPTTPPSPPGL